MGRQRRWHAAILAILLLSQSGCAVIGDLFNESFLTTLGLSPQVLIPPQGTAIVVFQNNTANTALFLAYEIPDADNPAGGARNFSAQVPPGAASPRNEVLRCPIDVIGPGSLDGAFAVVDPAVQVFVDGMATDVNYTGTPLRNGVDFRCGDTILIQLSGVGADADAFTIAVQVLPGL